MTSTALFHARNRRGLGHLMRAQNIASALRESGPHVTPHVHATHRPDPALWDDEIALTTDSDRSWAATRTRLRPTVIIHDTTLAHDLAEARREGDDARTVLVLRRRHVDQHHELLARHDLSCIDRFIVPHTIEEFGHELPARVGGRTSFVGPIARRPNDAGRAAIRRQLGIDPTEFLVTATVGGGGFAEQADRFFEIVGAMIDAVSATRPDAHFAVVLGPNYRNDQVADQLRRRSATTVVTVEPRLVDLVAASDLVIAEGGYNTVTEVRLAQTPTIFIPSLRRLDDQAERVELVAKTGAAVVVFPGDPLNLASDLAGALAGNNAQLAGMRSAAAARPLTLGNDAAARIITSLVDP